MNTHNVSIPPVIDDPIRALRKRPNSYLRDGIAKPEELAQALVKKWQRMKATDAKIIICNPWGGAYVKTDPHNGGTRSILSGEDLYEIMDLHLRPYQREMALELIRVECAEPIIAAFSKTVILYEKGQRPYYFAGNSTPPAEITECLDKDTALAIVFET